MTFFRPYNIGLVALLATPFLTSIYTSDPVMGLVFVPFLMLDSVLTRPYDYPRGKEVLKNSGFFILPARAVMYAVICLGLSVAGSQTGVGLAVWDWDTPSRSVILAMGVGVAVLAIGLRFKTRQRNDIFPSRTGIFGMFEAIDRFVSARSDFERTTTKSSPLIGPSSMVLVRPWLLNPPQNQTVPQILKHYLGFIRPDHHRLRLAYVLLAASKRGNVHAQSALQILIQREDFIADYRDDEVIKLAESVLPAQN